MIAWGTVRRPLPADELHSAAGWVIGAASPRQVPPAAPLPLEDMVSAGWTLPPAAGPWRMPVAHAAGSSIAGAECVALTVAHPMLAARVGLTEHRAPQVVDWFSNLHAGSWSVARGSLCSPHAN